jgi:hypothetical protein
MSIDDKAGGTETKALDAAESKQGMPPIECYGARKNVLEKSMDWIGAKYYRGVILLGAIGVGLGLYFYSQLKSTEMEYALLENSPVVEITVLPNDGLDKIYKRWHEQHPNVKVSNETFNNVVRKLNNLNNSKLDIWQSLKIPDPDYK